MNSTAGDWDVDPRVYHQMLVEARAMGSPEHMKNVLTSLSGIPVLGDPIRVVDSTIAHLAQHLGLTPVVNVASVPANSNQRPYLTGETLIDPFDRGLNDGFGFKQYHVPSCSAVEVAPGSVSTIGGYPGAGKSALAEQIVFELLAGEPELVVIIANVELSPMVLLARQMQRETGIAAKRILRDDLQLHELSEVKGCWAKLRKLADRIIIMQEANRVALVEAQVPAQSPCVVVLDYIQRFDSGQKDLRQNVNGVMDSARRMALRGAAVLAISALARQRNLTGGSTYQGAGLTAFKESGELEYSTDWAAILDGGVMDVVKNRFGETGPVQASFDGPSLTWIVGGEL